MVRRPLAGEGEVAWRKYAESLEERRDAIGLISFRLTRIEERLGIGTCRRSRPQWTDDGPMPCTCTIACIPQGKTEEQVCKESIRYVLRFGTRGPKVVDTVTGKTAAHFPGNAWDDPKAAATACAAFLNERA